MLQEKIKLGQVFMVHHGDVEQALRKLKQHLSKEGISPGKKAFFKKRSERIHEKIVEIKRKMRKAKIRRDSNN